MKNASKLNKIIYSLLKGGPGSGGAREGAGRPAGSGSKLSDEDKQKFDAEFGWESHLIGADQANNPYDLDKTEALSITMYTTQHYSSTNRGFREDNPKEKDKIMGKALDSALANSPVTEAEVYRGVRTPYGYTGTTSEYVEQNFKVGAEFKDSAYMSTSVSKSVAEEYAGSAFSKGDGIVLSISSKTGVDVSGYSMISGESEVLFGRNTRFVVDSVHYDDKTSLHHVKMTELDNKKLSSSNSLFLQSLTDSDDAHRNAIDKK